MDCAISTVWLSGSFKEKDNRSPEEQELSEIGKRNSQLEMEVDCFSLQV
ncbi:hypothetical protein JOC34_001479 [Virgibacillus halotolerans]|nr:hypothetical protein [Virgibacillus halotolerans]